ncbi:MAG: aminodeoxychorismate/anthranilate synthase component II [Gemmatimonadota bacterium]|nr:MAG: aminodeoxychorismate/anthranilate synthase component II [Gemmatimonadota bacterium]
MILVLDNYDSFTYNLVQYLGELGADVTVRRNDELTTEEVEELRPSAVLVSPGPGTPSEAGISISLVHWCLGRVPLLGVCLGHQAIAEALGGRIVRAERLMHGKTSPIAHRGKGIFKDIPSPFAAMRYHSLVVDPPSLPDDLTVTAWTDDRPPGSEIMAVEHVREPVFGVQFHPESIGTDVGRDLISNFLARV